MRSPNLLERPFPRRSGPLANGKGRRPYLFACRAGWVGAVIRGTLPPKGSLSKVHRKSLNFSKKSFKKIQKILETPRLFWTDDSIPDQLAKENKKFQYSLVEKKGTADKFAGCLQWIEDAGIITRCYNLHTTELPLEGNADKNVFKVYMNDIGLFVSTLEQGTQGDILRGNLLGYKGAILENLAASILYKMKRKHANNLEITTSTGWVQLHFFYIGAQN